ICCLERSNSSTPSSFSNLPTDVERADWTICTRWAAREKFISLATAMKYSSWRSSIPHSINFVDETDQIHSLDLMASCCCAEGARRGTGTTTTGRPANQQ